MYLGEVSYLVHPENVLMLETRLTTRQHLQLATRLTKRQHLHRPNGSLSSYD